MKIPVTVLCFPSPFVQGVCLGFLGGICFWSQSKICSSLVTWRLSRFRAISDLSKLEQIFWVNEGSEADFEMSVSSFDKYLSCFGCLKDEQCEAECQAQYNCISIGFLPELIRLVKTYRWAFQVLCRSETVVSVTQVSEETCTSHSYFL